MKTTEEKAKEYARCAQNCEKCGEDECLQKNFRCDHFRRVYYAFINGAKYQKEEDDGFNDGEALLYAVNKTAERTKKEVVDKACAWLKARNVLTDASLEGFRQAMEE